MTNGQPRRVGATRVAVIAMLLLCTVATLASDIIISDDFNVGTPWTTINVAGSTPSLANAPGGVWIKTSGWYWSQPIKSAPEVTWFSPTDACNMAENGVGIVLPLTSAGSYTKPTRLMVSARLTMFGGEAGVGGVGLGFFPTPNTPDTGEGFTLVGFSGIMLRETGSIVLYANGAVAETLPCPVFVKSTFYNLSYTVDTSDGSVSGVLLDGDAYAFAPGATPFTDSATMYVGCVVSGGQNARGAMDDFVVERAPAAAAAGTAILVQ